MSPKSKKQKNPKRTGKKVLKVRSKAHPRKHKESRPHFDWEKSLRDLVEKGRNRGFVTEAEILDSIPGIENHLSELEQLFDKLESLGIEAVDQEVASVWEQNKPVEKGTKSKSRVSAPESYDLGDIYDDSIQMYLREIGKVSLLKGDEEVELAKRITKGDVAARKKLTEANLRLVVNIAKRYNNRGLGTARSYPGG